MASESIAHSASEPIRARGIIVNYIFPKNSYTPLSLLNSSKYNLLAGKTACQMDGAGVVAGLFLYFRKWCVSDSYGKTLLNALSLKSGTLGARDFSSAVSCFAAHGFGLRPTPKIPAAREKNLWYTQGTRVANANILLTISTLHQEKSLWELIKWLLKRKCFDLSSNSLASNSSKKCMETTLENLHLDIGT